MFRFLQVIVVVILFIGILILFGKKLHKSRAFITGLSVVLMISAICSGVILTAIPMPTEIVQIIATGEKNEKAKGNAIGIKGVIVDGKKYPIDNFEEVTWFYSKDDAAYLWLNDTDERLKKPITQEITLAIPVGAGRKLVFLTGEQFGIVGVSYGGEYKTYNLYKDESGVKNISIPDSNRVYDDFIKIYRLGGYSLIIVLALALAVLLERNFEKQSLLRLIYMILSIITTLSFGLNLGLTTRSGRNLYALIYDFNRSFSYNFVLAIILVPMLYKAFLYCGEIYREKFASVRGTFCIILPAGLFSVFMVIGAAFASDNTLCPIFNNELQILKSLFAASGYFAIFFFGITWIFNYLDCVNIYKIPQKNHFKVLQIYLDSLNKRPFSAALITLIILYIPYMIASYPGIFMGDAGHQIPQVYGVYELNNAHPVMHTLLIGFCIKTGEIFFKSVNAGLFIYSILQYFVMSITIAILVKVLVNLKISTTLILVLILYYGIHPRIQGYMFLMTKDLINTAFLLIFMLSIYMLITQKHSVLIYALLGLSDLGAMLFRHDSQYVIVISLFILGFMIRDFRRQFTVIAACSLGFMLLWNNVLLPAVNVLPRHPWSPSINPGIFGNMMAQQTARYIRDAGDAVTAREKEAINACFDYDQIVSSYDPDYKSDGVVGTIRPSVTQGEWRNYQKTWLEMFFKHPEIYLEATLNHKYQYLYPRLLTTDIYSYAYSSDCMNVVNERVSEMTTKFSYPNSLNQFRLRYQGLRESFFRIPIVNLLFTTCSYYWLLFIWFFYCISKIHKEPIAIMMPLIIYLFALIAGPCNGRYFRYTYPYAFCLPILIVLGLHCIKRRTTERGKSA